ncbi:MAG: hypothetical protein II153_03425 [Erysipelotrichaceae bacterium]|nr:hypothetical protein [Erysipelotrichaceae bacterium]
MDEAGLLQIRQLTMILVIESGEIRESGTHDELLKMNGIYERMDKIQNSAQEKGITYTITQRPRNAGSFLWDISFFYGLCHNEINKER